MTFVKISDGGKKSPRTPERTVHSTSTSIGCPFRILSNIAEVRSMDLTNASGSTSGKGSSAPGWFSRSAASVYMHVSRSCRAGSASNGLGCFSRSIATFTICSATFPTTLLVATSLSRPCWQISSLRNALLERLCEKCRHLPVASSGANCTRYSKMWLEKGLILTQPALPCPVAYLPHAPAGRILEPTLSPDVLRFDLKRCIKKKE